MKYWDGQHVTSPLCRLSVEHGVLWPQDSSTTPMKAGVNSGDACHANRLQLNYRRDLRSATPQNSSNILLVKRVYQFSPLPAVLLQAAIPPWPVLILGHLLIVDKALTLLLRKQPA